MLSNFVLSKRIAGTSRDDAELDITQLAEGDDYEISDPKRLIASYMHMCLGNYIDAGYSVAFIRKLLDKSGVYRLRSLEEEQQVYIIVNNRDKKYQYDIYGEYTVRHIFYIKEYDTDDIIYVAAEHIANPEPDCDLIMRCYRPYFETAGAAQRYCNRNMAKYHIEKGAPSSGYKVLVKDKAKTDDSLWYKKNIKAAKYIVKYELDAEDYRYIVDLDDVLSAVFADAYDDLPDNERAFVDRNIYNSIRDYISADSCYSIDEMIDVTTGDDLSDMVDVAMLLALSQAEDEATFYKIHELLGPNEYRVGAITDEIYNAHPEQGYIMISKDGQLGWFPPTDGFLNDWDGASSSPFYKKLQPNENDTLLCLREFHPDLFVDSLPTPMELDKCRHMYALHMAEQRRQHPEFVFKKDGDTTYGCGTWYPRGVMDAKCYPDVMFPIEYGSHTFSEQECKDLLSGEEIVVEHYMTKMGIESTIRGKLKEVMSMFDDDSTFEFTRTDIDAKQRASLNAEFGIQEPGLPGSNDE